MNEILAFRPFIIKHSLKYPYTFRQDLIQEGFIGAMKAIQKFDAGRNIPLIVYAIFHIRGAMRDYYQAKCKKHLNQLEIIDSFDIPVEQDYISSIYKEQVLDMLPKAMLVLTDREQDFIQERYLKETPTFLHILGTRYNVSEQRAQQIEVIALTKLKNIIG